MIFRVSAAMLVLAFVCCPKARSGPAAVAGESVYVHLSTVADVTAVLSFEERGDVGVRELYFPVFGHAKDEPLHVLDESGLEVDIDGKRAETIAPCDPPRGFKNVAAGRRVFWFRVDVGETVADEARSGTLAVRVHYAQALLGGRFYFLPMIPGQDNEQRSGRAWAWQLHARSDVKVPKIVGPDTDHDQLRDTVVAYLHHGSVVEIER